MAISIRDIQSKSPQVLVEGGIQLEEPDVEDVTNPMIVGPADRGPSFVPTEIRTPEEFEEVFGEVTSYAAFSAKETLKQTDRINFLRVSSTEGWNPTPLIITTTSGTDFPHFRQTAQNNLLALFLFDDKYKKENDIDPTKTKLVKTSPTTKKSAESFTMETYDTGGNLVDAWDLSLDPFSGKYIERVLSPQVRIYHNFRESQSKIVDQVESVFVQLQVLDGIDSLKFDSFSSPKTPWILSQDKSSGLRHRLFRFWIRGDGADQNRRFKISVTDIGRGTSESNYPTFTVNLRKFEDSDLNQQIVEKFPDLSLNPEDERYIEKVIGTEYKRYNEQTRRVESFGVFDQNSYKIRVEAASEIEQSDKNTLPFGFEAYRQTFTQSSQTPVYRTEQDFPGRLLDYKAVNSPDTEKGESIGENLHLGIEFRIEENENFFKGVPEGAEKVGDPFKLDDYVDPQNSQSDERKFTLGFQGGSDGESIYKQKFSGKNIVPQNTFGLNFDGKFSGGKVAYRKAFDLLKDSQGGYEFNLLTTPELDIQNHKEVIRNAERLVRERGDAFYVFDSFVFSDSPKKAQSINFEIDTTYAATYYNWVKPTADIDFEYVPPSSIIPQTYARSDSTAETWFSPAGPDRGQIPNVEDLLVRLSREKLDQLYGVSVNPIRFTDPGGILLSGNRCFTKDLSTALSSIDVRRGVIQIITKSKKISRNYLFEQTTPEVGNQLKSEIQNYLSTVQTKEGIKDYQVEVSTPSSRERFNRNPNTIKVSVSFIPRSSSEYITLEFAINEKGINVIT